MRVAAMQFVRDERAADGEAQRDERDEATAANPERLQRSPPVGFEWPG